MGSVSSLLHSWLRGLVRVCEGWDLWERSVRVHGAAGTKLQLSQHPHLGLHLLAHRHLHRLRLQSRLRRLRLHGANRGGVPVSSQHPKHCTRNGCWELREGVIEQ